MKSKGFVFLVLCTMLLIFPGCHKKLSQDSSSVLTMDDLVVADSFNWETTKVANLQVSVEMLPENIGKLVRISVFDGNPAQSGKLLINGGAGYESPFEAEIKLPSATGKLFLLAEDGTGQNILDSVAVSSDIQYTFSQAVILKDIVNSSADPDCSKATPQNTLSGDQAVTISNGTQYYVTGLFTGAVTFAGSGGSINVCGTLHPQSITNMGAGCFICATQGGSVILDNTLTMGNGSRLTAYSNSHIHLGGMVMNGTTPRLINYCNDWVVNSQFTTSGGTENYGSMLYNGGLNITPATPNFVTTGSITVNGDLNLSTTFWNNGKILVTGHFNLNGGTFYHNCSLIVQQDLVLNSGSITLNGAYLKETGNLLLNPGVTVLIKNNSMISTNTYTQNITVTGTGGRSEIKIASYGGISGTNKVTGSIETVTPSGTLSHGGASNFTSGATLTKISSALNIIPVSACNPEGIGGTPLPPDIDGDGVADALDAYPSDPTRAFINYYPAKSTFGSLFFEDLWPGKGDYDMNDLVLDYQFTTITNAQNKVVDINELAYVRAAGAGMKNGFGFQIDGLLPGQIASVSGCSLKHSYISNAANGSENGQTKAVIIVFDDFNNVIHRSGTSFFNTLPDALKGTADTIKVNIHLSSPQPVTTVGSPPFNPFLIRNMDRSVEIHLPDNQPTSLANIALFGTMNDNSVPSSGRYYKTQNNLPWAMNTPVKYNYTVEKFSILSGYTHFAEWAESSGSYYPDWYTNKTGYRTESNIYK